MSKSASGKYRKFVLDGKEYLYTQYDLFRLELLEKLSSIVAVLTMAMVGLMLVASVWVYISCILIMWMQQYLDSYIPAFIIMGAVNLSILFAIILLKKQLILNPLIKVFSKILFDRYSEVDDYDEDDDMRDVEHVKNSDDE